MKEALKLALEALYDEESVDKAIAAIKEALTQPPPPPECKTEAEQTAYAFGWWKALESVRTEQPEQEPVAWMNNKDFEPIRVRIMQEAYELADRNDSESYNAIKVMCGDVQRMLPPKRPWVGLTDGEIQVSWDGAMDGAVFTRRNVYNAIEAKLKEKNT
jgi:hypothetical protein